MFTRRKFLKVFGLASVAFSFLPTIFTKRSLSEASDVESAGLGSRNWLYGYPHRGCSTPGLNLEHLREAGRDLQDFVHRASHEQFVS
jgi:hypothetical protein